MYRTGNIEENFVLKVSKNNVREVCFRDDKIIKDTLERLAERAAYQISMSVKL